MVIGSRWSRHMTRRMARIRCNSLYTEKKRLAIMAPVVVMTPPSGVFVEWVITLIVIPCSLLLLSFSCSSSCSSYCSPLLSSSLPRCPWCHKPTQPHCPPHMHAGFFSPTFTCWSLGPVIRSYYPPCLAQTGFHATASGAIAVRGHVYRLRIPLINTR